MQTPDRARTRILDAAVACMLEQGWRATSLTDVAERAGLSRPTVYKHAGDRDAIGAAVRDREFERFVQRLAGLLADAPGPREAFVDGIVFSVGYARDHALFQRLLASEPEAVLPWLTRDAAPLLERIVEVLAPHIEHAVARGQVRAVDPRVAAEWAGRLGISLVLTPSVTVPLQRPGTLRNFVEGLFEIGLSPEPT